MSRQVMQEASVSPETIDACFANVIAEGDIVNFRFLFMPASPLRSDSPEDIMSPKYAYLFPEDEENPRYQEALRLVQHSSVSRYIQSQLEKKGPPQLPWELVMALADNAVLLGKYTAASQAYELLRIRRRMQEVLLDKADALLQRGRMDAGVQGYLIAAGLDYDYAAFPEPLPAVPNFQERALRLHGTYQNTSGNTFTAQDIESQVSMALNYLLANPDLAQRLRELPCESKINFLALLVRRMDDAWDGFTERYKQALQVVRRYQPLLDKINSYSPDALDVLYEPILNERQRMELQEIPSMLMGISVKDWEWWQCVKTLCYHHPAAALFISRQRLSAKEGVIIPVCNTDSPLVRALNLC